MNQHNKTFLILFCLPFLLFSSPSVAMPGQVYAILKVIFAGTFEQRQEQRKQEAKIAEIKQLPISAVEHEINIIKNEHYKKILNELQRITDRPYDDLKREIDKQRTLTKTLLQQENTRANHDPDLPNFITQKLCESISQHNINPNNIDLTYKNSDTAVATACGGNIFTGSFIFNPKIIDKPKITINDSLLKQSEHYHPKVYHHEISHILLQHTYILKLAYEKLPNIILEEATTKPHTASEMYYKKKGVSRLASLIEEEADINAALTNSQVAYTSMQARCSFWPHNHITDKQNHCKQLTTIYTLMKQKEK